MSSRRRGARGVAVALALFIAASLSGLLGGNATAAAAPPIVIGSCATSVQGVPGQPVALAPSAVLGIVVDAVRAVPVVGPPLANTVRTTLSGLAPIPIGVLPTGDGHISGAAIATAVVAKLPLLGTVLAGAVRSALTSACGVTVKGVNAVAAPVQDGAKSVADASEQATGALPGRTPGSPGPGGGEPGRGSTPGTGAPGGGVGGPAAAPELTMPGPNQPVLGGVPTSGLDLSGFLWTGRSPMADYGSIPFARPGLFVPSPGVRYGGSVSGYTPQFGILGTDTPDDGVQAAGHAEAVPPAGGNKIALPVLLAVFALAGVTAALVRTWVLRKAPAPATQH